MAIRRTNPASVCVMLSFLTLCPAAGAAELYVPSGYDTIQAAIDAAIDGDTVIVAPGTHTGDAGRNLDFGAELTVTGQLSNPLTFKGTDTITVFKERR